MICFFQPPLDYIERALRSFFVFVKTRERSQEGGELSKDITSSILTLGKKNSWWEAEQDGECPVADLVKEEETPPEANEGIIKFWPPGGRGLSFEEIADLLWS